MTIRPLFIFASVACFAVNAFSQQPIRSHHRRTVKTNTRPAEKPAKAEPFDGADVKTLASKCVTLDTDSGAIEIELYPEHAPESVRSFLNLVSLGYLDTTTFGRVVPNFVIQGGDLYSREGQVSYEVGMRARRVLPDEPNKILHERGVHSMARGDEPTTAMTTSYIGWKRLAPRRQVCRVRRVKRN